MAEQKTEQKTGLETVIDAGRKLGESHRIPGGGAYVVAPNSDRIHDLENLEAQPRRIRADVGAHDVATFIGYFKLFAMDSAVIFANLDEFSVTGIIDYHDEKPSWCTHKVVYAAPRSHEWNTWSGKSGRAMSQADFAQFIEDNVVDIRTPAGADILEVARNLQAKKSVDFSSAIKLSTGEQEFTFSETVQGSSAKGKLKVPEEFVLGIPVFQGGIAYEVRARLRYRISDAKLALWYELYRPHAIIKDAFDHILAQIAAETDTTVWQGVAG